MTKIAKIAGATMGAAFALSACAALPLEHHVDGDKAFCMKQSADHYQVMDVASGRFIADIAARKGVAHVMDSGTSQAATVDEKAQSCTIGNTVYWLKPYGVN